PGFVLAYARRDDASARGALETPNHVEMSGISLLAKHDVLAVRSEVKVAAEFGPAGTDGPFLHGDVPSDVEADQLDDRRVCAARCQPELILAGPTDRTGVGAQLGQRVRFPT